MISSLRNRKRIYNLTASLQFVLSIEYIDNLRASNKLLNSYNLYPLHWPHKPQQIIETRSNFMSRTDFTGRQVVGKCSW